MTEPIKKPFWVEDTREAWKWFSMWVSGVGAAAMLSFLMLDETQRAALFALVGVSPEQGVAIGAFLTFLANMLARVKNQ